MAGPDDQGWGPGGPWASPPTLPGGWGPTPARPRAVWAVLAVVGLLAGLSALALLVEVRAFLHEVELDPDRPVHDGDADAAFWFGGLAVLVLVGLAGLTSLLGAVGTSPLAWQGWVRGVAVVGLLLAGSTVLLAFLPLGWGPG